MAGAHAAPCIGYGAWGLVGNPVGAMGEGGPYGAAAAAMSKACWGGG